MKENVLINYRLDKEEYLDLIKKELSKKYHKQLELTYIFRTLSNKQHSLILTCQYTNNSGHIVKLPVPQYEVNEILTKYVNDTGYELDSYEYEADTNNRFNDIYIHTYRDNIKLIKRLFKRR